MGKHIFGIFLSFVVLCSALGYAADIRIDPDFFSERFPPTTGFHADCTNSARIQLVTKKNEDINGLRLILSYNPQEIQILSLQPADNFDKLLDTKVDYDSSTITLIGTNFTNNSTTTLLTIFFKNNKNITGSRISFHSPSYLLTKSEKKIPVFVEKDFSFLPVPECEPDLLPPVISLVRPKSLQTPLTQDSYFIFSLKDSGKGIDRNSVILRFNGIVYTGEHNPAFFWQNDYLVFYPQDWLPINTGINLHLRISDKQIYGGENTTKKSFSFVTSSGVSFEHYFTPGMLRQTLKQTETTFASKEECAKIPSTLSSLAIKMGCSLSDLKKGSPEGEQQNLSTNQKFFSVFALLGWIFFGISFFLKLYYVSRSRKHKKALKHLAAKHSQFSL